MQSILICSGTREERWQVAQEKAGKVGREDLTILESATSLGIEEVRQLKHSLALKSYSSPYKVCLLKEVENLTLPAQNALLKTLEEPPENTLLILTTPTRETLLSTIVSRCQVIELSPKVEIELSKEEFQNQLSIINYQLSSGVGERLKLAQKVGRIREETLKWIDEQTLIWREILIKKYQVLSIKYQVSDGQCNNLTMKQLVFILRQIQATKTQIQANVNPRFALENLLLNFPQTLPQTDRQAVKDMLK